MPGSLRYRDGIILAEGFSRPHKRSP